LAKLVGFGQNWLNLDKILGKIKTKFGNCGEISAKVTGFWQI